MVLTLQHVYNASVSAMKTGKFDNQISMYTMPDNPGNNRGNKPGDNIQRFIDAHNKGYNDNKLTFDVVIEQLKTKKSDIMYVINSIPYILPRNKKLLNKVEDYQFKRDTDAQTKIDTDNDNIDSATQKSVAKKILNTTDEAIRRQLQTNSNTNILRRRYQRQRLRIKFERTKLYRGVLTHFFLEDKDVRAYLDVPLLKEHYTAILNIIGKTGLKFLILSDNLQEHINGSIATFKRGTENCHIDIHNLCKPLLGKFG